MGTIKAFTGIAAIVIAIYVSWLLIPPYFANYQFEDDLHNIAISNTYGNKTEDDIRDVVFSKAKALEIPLSKEQIKVTKTGPSNAGSLEIEVDYSVHVELPGYPLDLHFQPSTANRSVM
ncbi:MAG TPA: hypothetical protein VFA89_08190 [Terriglobales bacterium]|nr:hypothetical protein [Terriglobales bacterium]